MHGLVKRIVWLASARSVLELTTNTNSTKIMIFRCYSVLACFPEMCPVISIPFAKCEVTSLIIDSLSRKLEQIQTLQLPTRVLDNHLILSHAPAHNKCNNGRYMYMYSDSFSGVFDTNIARNNCINTQTCIIYAVPATLLPQLFILYNNKNLNSFYCYCYYDHHHHYH